MEVVRLMGFGGAISLTSTVVRLSGGDWTPRAPLQPPAWVFGVVWPILYVTTGLSWAHSKSDLLFGVITGLCCAWLVTYVFLRRMRLSALILLTTMLLTMMERSLAPLSVWLTFATFLNLYNI